jgi:hypothetical protein
MLQFLDVITYAAFAIGLLTLPFVVFTWFSYVWKGADRTGTRIPLKSTLLFVASISFGICVSFISTSIAQDEVLEKINSLPVNGFHISINGETVKNPENVVSVLKTLHSIFPHHSNPTKRITIRIYENSLKLTLILARDSGNLREYWVFYPKYRVTRYNEIGRIRTPALDAY